MSNPDQNVLFTGGVPADTVGDVFRLLSDSVGARALAYPDGEIGERQGWIMALGATTWSKSAGIEEIDTPLSDDDPMAVFKAFRLGDGVTEVSLDGLLPYAKGAIESYAIFRRMRDEGVIPASVRFQMPIPMAHDAVCFYFPNRDDWPIVMAAWIKALRREYEEMLAVIPAEDLVIQLDYCTELCQIAGATRDQAEWMPTTDPDRALAEFTAESYVAPHSAGLPDEVLLGYHICAGTYPTQPVAQLEDIALPVEVANRLTKSSGRRVDYFHLPVMRESHDAYFTPLERLGIDDGARVFLGLECNDGLDALKSRIDDAGRHLDDFGVAHYCGYQLNADVLPSLLRDLASGADYQAEGR
jgi:hypothetical protein